MKKKLRVLVTAVSGDLGQSIIKALAWGSLKPAVFGADMKADGIGRSFVDTFMVFPPAAEKKKFLSKLNNFCGRNQIDAIIPSSEIEIKTLACALPDLTLPCGAKIIVQPKSCIEAYSDKLRCMENLRGKVPLADFADGKNKNDVKLLIGRAGFPLVVKPRNSSGSRSLFIVSDLTELKVALNQTPDAIVQEFIDDSGGEFSIGVYAREHASEVIAFKRDLGPVGCTWYAESSNDSQVLRYARHMLKVLVWRGAGNIQVRKGKKGVRLLEINPRFSSLVAARTLSGFRDVDWSLEDALGLSPSALTRDFKKIRFQRFFHEKIDAGRGFQDFSRGPGKKI